MYKEESTSVVNAVTSHLTCYGMTVEEKHEFPIVGILDKKSLQAHSIMVYTICDEVNIDTCVS